MFIVDFPSFHNGLKHLCSLKLVSILTATLGKVVMKLKIVMFFNFLGIFFSKYSFLSSENFISPSIRYPINLIFSVLVCICKIHVLMGYFHVKSYKISVSCHTYLIDFFEIFTSGRYHKDMKVLKIFASNFKHCRICGTFNK